MRNYVLIIIFISAFLLQGCSRKQRNTAVKNLYKQEIESRVWKTNCVIGEKTDDNIVRFKLDTISSVKMIGFLSTLKDKRFTSKNVSPCGNDYFTTVYGKYEFYDHNKVMISVDSICFSGEWKKPSEYKNGEETEYLISKNKNKIIFTKID
jgi:hypothetical protein